MVFLFPPYCNSKSKCLLWLCVHKLVTIPFPDCLVFHDPTYSQDKPLSLSLAINMRITFTAVITKFPIEKRKSFLSLSWQIWSKHWFYSFKAGEQTQIIKEKCSEQAFTKQWKPFLHLKQFITNITSFITVKKGFTIISGFNIIMQCTFPNGFIHWAGKGLTIHWGFFCICLN